MKFKDWLPEWLEHYIQPSAKEKTMFYYNVIVKRHLIPNLGDYEMDELTPFLLQQYVTNLTQRGNLRTGKGLAANTVNSIITVIQCSLRQAYEVGINKDYTAYKIKRPKTKEKQITCFTPEEQKKIEKAVMNEKKIKMFGVLLTLYTGLRIGELLALEWTDVDFKKGEISVNRSCHDSMRDGKYCRVCEEPKTETSKRIVPVPKQLVPLLRDVKKKNGSRYVVGDGEKIIPIRSYQCSFSMMLDKLKIPHRGFHSLRHTFATRALECGMDVRTLSEILGHKNPTVTLNRYAHSLLSHKHAAMDRLGKLL